MKSAWIAIALAACQGHHDEAKPAGEEKIAVATSDAAALAIVESDAAPASEEGSGSGTGSPTEVPEIANGGDPDDAEAVAKSATSVWQAVVDRDRYLARRGQGGVVEGRLGGPVEAPPVAPTPPNAIDAGAPPAPAFTWLVDDTEGDGALAIHVDLSGVSGAPPKAGARVAITGAWTLDDSRHWVWKAASIVALPATPPPDPATQVPPGHVPAAQPMPADARAASRIGDGSGTIVFQILAPPRQDGDGWTIANQLGDPAIARLILPGERPSYGGHDLRTPDERWQLKRAVPYWVRIGKLHKPPAAPAGQPPALPTVHALGAPRRVP